MITPKKYFELAYKICEEQGDPEIAQGQMKYMRNQFEYFGLKAKEWQGIAKQLFKEEGVFQGPDLINFVKLCFADDHRELNYLCIEMAQRAQRKEEEDFIDLIEEMILTKSWWDTVDWLAGTLTGKQFKKFPHQIEPYTTKWMQSGNRWLQRSCILFQLKYKEDLNEKLLFDFILQMKDSKEFFLQKAAGWALRQHSRFKPESVIQFTKSHQLAPLTQREALRLLKKK